MKQLILCVETNKKANTDSGYIDTAIKRIYYIDGNIKLQYVYFDGKGKSITKKIVKEIDKLKNALTSPHSTEVVYFIDTDKYDSDFSTRELNEEIQLFCQNKGYKLVWFCRDVEEVFLHKTVDDSRKKEEVAKFNANNNLGMATIETLSVEKIARKKSNMLLVLDKLLDRKLI